MLINRQTRIKHPFLRRTATATALGLSSAVLFAATPAQAEEATYTFIPMQLDVYDIEDWWPDTHDELKMVYAGTTWMQTLPRGSYTDMFTPANFTGSHMSLNLWERDRGVDNNHLGEADITADSLGQERFIRFKTDWYDYQIKYKVVRAT
jgi:hypothetical protein